MKPVADDFAAIGARLKELESDALAHLQAPKFDDEPEAEKADDGEPAAARAANSIGWAPLVLSEIDGEKVVHRQPTPNRSLRLADLRERIAVIKSRNIGATKALKRLLEEATSKGEMIFGFDQALQSAEQHRRVFGTGYVKVTPKGVFGLSIHELVATGADRALAGQNQHPAPISDFPVRF